MAANRKSESLSFVPLLREESESLIARWISSGDMQIFVALAEIGHDRFLIKLTANFALHLTPNIKQTEYLQAREATQR